MTNPVFRRAWLVGWVLLCAVGIAGARSADAPKEHWYQVQIEGQPSGWMRSNERREPGKKAGDEEVIETSTDMSIALRRGPVSMTMKVATRFRETATGKPVSAMVVQSLGGVAGMEVTKAFSFVEGGVKIVTIQNGQETEESVQYTDADKGWMSPVAVERMMDEQVARGAKDLRYRTVDVSNGPRPIEVVMKRRGDETVQVMGKAVPAVRWDQTTSIAPSLVMAVFMSETGEMLRSDVAVMPGMTMTVLAADEALAKAKVNPPELVAQTMLHPDRPIAQPRKLRHAVYEVELKPAAGGDKAPDAVLAGALAQTSSQRVEKLDGTRSRVTVDVAVPIASPRPGPEFLAANAMLNHADPKVRELLTRALQDLAKDADDLAKARAIRRFVHGYIERKDLSVGFATASEVARTRQGDCTEHAVLLAALLRGEGVPSRTVSGMLYVDEFIGQTNVFGYHMWSEAWIADADGKAGRWVPLDAVLESDTTFDAAHIAMATSSMAEGAMTNDMVALVPVMGKLSVKVVKTE